MRRLSRIVMPVCASLLALPAVAEESSVTLYGILDEAIANIQHGFSFSPVHPVQNNPTVTRGTQSVTGVLNGGMSQTRWGLKGQEDLGGGQKAFFALEEAFNLPSGSISNAAASLANNGAAGPGMSADSAIAGQLFNRGAYVGLSSPTYGAISFGRQQSLFLDNIAMFDPLLGSQAFSPIGFSGTYGGGGATDDSRVDNSVKYVLSLGDVRISAVHKFGGVAGSSSAQSADQINAVYASGALAAQLGYSVFHDAFAISNATGTGTIKATAEDTTSIMAAVRVVIGPASLRAGYEREAYDNPSNASQDLTVTSLFGYTLAAQASVTAFPQEKVLNVYWIGGGYEITPKFTVLAGAYHVSNNYDPSGCAARTQLSRCSGALNYTSLAADYFLSKRTDFYAGVMLSQVSGGAAAAVLNPAPTPSENSNRIMAIGMRHRF